MQLPQAFLANLIVFVLLAVMLLVVLRAATHWVWLVDALIVLSTLATLYGWNRFGRPNPQSLGTWAVVMEIVLMVLALVHLALFSRRPVLARG